jgi:hypothetical protein
MPRKKNLETEETVKKTPRTEIMIRTGDHKNPKEVTASWNLKNQTWTVNNTSMTARQFADLIETGNDYWLSTDDQQSAWQISHLKE